MAEVLTPDICIIGGGPGGVAAAEAALGEGVSVVLVEKGALGGANLASALPTRALASAAEIAESLRLAPAVGVSAAPLQFNLAKIRDHLTAVNAAVAPRLTAAHLAVAGVRVIAGVGRFADPNTLAVGETVIRARRYILAVGSIPSIPAIPGLDGVEVATLATGIDLTRKPTHLIILGGGPYALEYAQACNRLGIDATVLADGDALPGFDREAADFVLTRLRAEGVGIRERVTIGSVARRKGGVRFAVTDPDEEVAGEMAVDGSHVLVATGRTPDIAELNLVVAGIRHDSNGIAVDGLRTTNRRVFAIGDAIAGSASVARAVWQGREAVRAILFRSRADDSAAHIPDAVFTDPAIATVGLQEPAARARHGGARVLRLPFVENERATIERASGGFIKVVTTRGGRVLGASIVGRGADEQIALWSLAIANRLTLSALAALAAPYPTRSELARQLAVWGITGAERAGDQGLTSPWRRRIIRWLGKLG